MNGTLHGWTSAVDLNGVVIWKIICQVARGIRWRGEDVVFHTDEKINVNVQRRGGENMLVLYRVWDDAVGFQGESRSKGKPVGYL